MAIRQIIQMAFITVLITAQTINAKNNKQVNILLISTSEKSMLDIIKKNKGVLTPELKLAYYNFCESEAIKQLATVEVTLSEEQLQFIKRDKEIYEACFGTVYPVDARIMLNILELRKQLGEKLFTKYKGVCIASAVVRRNAGLSEGRVKEKEEWSVKCPADPKDYMWRKYSVVTIPNKYLAPLKKSKEEEKKDKKLLGYNQLSKKQKKKRAEYKKKVEMYGVSKAGIDKYMAYLKENNLTPSSTYTNEELAQKAIAAMGDDAPKAKRFNVAFYKGIMHSQGLRPKERDPFPAVAEYIRFLDTLPSHRFPVTKAPWAIMFPLAKGWPLREAKDIIMRHNNVKKLMTYGKYQDKKSVYEKRFLPLKWHYSSWQGKVQAGGVCHEMSSIGVGTYQAFGIPSCKAGRPNHSYVMYFTKGENGYECKSKQGAARGGRSQWGFADPKVEYPFVFHQGLALAMNIGINEYMDTRVAVNMSKILTRANMPDLEQALLRNAAKINPYNTELWFALNGNNQGSMIHRANLFSYINRLLSSSHDDVVMEQQYDVNVDFSKVAKVATTTTSKNNNSGYINYLTSELGDVEPSNSLETNKKILKVLKPLKGSAINNINNIISRLDVAVYGWQKLGEQVLTAATKEVVLKNKYSVSKDLVNNAKIVMSQGATNSNQAEYTAWLKKLAVISSKKQLYKPKRKRQYLDPLYKMVIPAVVKQLKQAGKRDDAKLYQEQFENASSKVILKSRK